MRSIAPILLCLLFLHACSSDRAPKQSSFDKEAALSIRPGYKIGIPYTIKGKRYYPQESFSYSVAGTASWYGDYFHGRLTANGEIFDMHAMTAAHKTLQLPAIVRVTNLRNGRSAIVRVNDRGPFIGDRIIDLSKGAAEALGFRSDGLAPVRVEVMPEASRRLRAIAGARAAVRDMDSMVTDLNRNPPDDLPAGPPVQITQNTAPRAAAPIVPRSGWFLQAAAFGDPANANRARTMLQDVGPIMIITRPSGERILYLVRVGPYGNKQNAQSALERVRKAGFDGALLVSAS